MATCCTVVREPATGIEYLIVGYEMLWFGEKLGKSLLNQNQIRYAGHMVRDDPTCLQEEGFGITFADGGGGGTYSLRNERDVCIL